MARSGSDEMCLRRACREKSEVTYGRTSHGLKAKGMPRTRGHHSYLLPVEVIGHRRQEIDALAGILPFPPCGLRGL